MLKRVLMLNEQGLENQTKIRLEFTNHAVKDDPWSIWVGSYPSLLLFWVRYALKEYRRRRRGYLLSVMFHFFRQILRLVQV